LSDRPYGGARLFQTFRERKPCVEKPALVRSMLNSLTGRTVRKCECGEKAGTEAKK
jgi:hypothetical protein